MNQGAAISPCRANEQGRLECEQILGLLAEAVDRLDAIGLNLAALHAHQAHQALRAQISVGA